MYRFLGASTQIMTIKTWYFMCLASQREKWSVKVWVTITSVIQNLKCQDLIN